jgi:hypothetical protein
MTWKTSLTIAATSLILAGPAMAQAPAPGGVPSPSTPSPTTPSTPGAPTPRMPSTTTPGVPGSSTPGMPDPTPGVQCPPGQARRPGSSMCNPATPGIPLPAPTK